MIFVSEHLKLHDLLGFAIIHTPLKICPTQFIGLDTGQYKEGYRGPAQG
jgi:hypothetical protein